MQFVNPLWLLGMSGVLIPLAIHLLSRKEGKLIRVGSLRHLEETSTRQFKSIKLNEILLLILRSLLILWIVMLLAGVYWPSFNTGKENWVLIEKGLEHDPSVVQMIDSLKKDGYETHGFADDFPIINDTITQRPYDYWKLLEELKKKSLQNAVIISSSRVNAFKGVSTSLPENFKWITRDSPEADFIVSSVPVGSDSVWLRKGKFSTERTEFISSVKFDPSQKTINPLTLIINIVAEKQFSYDSKIIQASLKSIDESVPQKISVQVMDKISQGASADWTIVLCNEIPQEITDKSIVFRQTQSDDLIVQESHDQWILTKHLTPDNAIEKQLTLRLAGILLPQKDAWKKSTAKDIRTANEDIFPSGKSSDETTVNTEANTNELWTILLAITLLTERWISFKRNQ